MAEILISMMALNLEGKGQVQDMFGLDNDWGMKGNGEEETRTISLLKQ